MDKRNHYESKQQNKAFLAAPALASLTDQMFNLIGQITKNPTWKHHQFNNAYIRRHNACIKSLLPVLESHVSFAETSLPLTNIITDQIFSEDISKDMLSFEPTGMRVYNELIEERLKPNSTKSINNPKKIEDQRHWQRQDKRVARELLPLCKMSSNSRQEEHWDMKVIVGDYKLTVLPKSLFASDSSLFDGSKSKSDAVRVT